MEFEDKLKEKMKKIDINLDENQLLKFRKYKDLLLEWNEKINLTSIIDEDEIILKHFIDSAIVKKFVNENEKVADIGTGAGFPGIPLKIINKSQEVCLIDSLNKRIIFLNEVISTLNLNNICAVHYRAEDIGRKKEYRQKYDVVTSRAVAKLNVLLEYMIPLTKVGGRCICLKGPQIDQELEEAKNCIKILGGKIKKVEKITLPESDIARTIIVIECVKQLPNKYPRKPGTPASSPL